MTLPFDIAYLSACETNADKYIASFEKQIKAICECYSIDSEPSDLAADAVAEWG